MACENDTGYKQLFAHAQLLRDLLATFTPFAWVRDIPLAHFERVNASFVSERASQRHADMVWRVRAGDEWVYVYVLLEFQSARDRWMALRVQVYTGLLYQDLIKGRRIKPGRRLPAVLPVVFYNGDKPWNAALDLCHLVEPLPDGLDQFIPTQRYVVIDQRRLDPKLLADSKSLVATLFRMELADRPDVLEEAVPPLLAWLLRDEFEPVRRTVGLWLQRRFAREFKGELVYEVTGLEEGADMAIYPRKYDTWTDAVMDRGRQEGLQKGRQEGREEGQAKGMHRLLMHMAHKRFGADSERLIALIDGASDQEMERFSDLLVSARSADEVVQGWAGSPPPDPKLT